MRSCGQLSGLHRYGTKNITSSTLRSHGLGAIQQTWVAASNNASYLQHEVVNGSGSSLRCLQHRQPGARWPKSTLAYSHSAAASKPANNQARVTVSAAGTATDLSASSSAAADDAITQKKAVVVGASPSGLAAAAGLAQKAGYSVDVYDSRPDPRTDKHGAHASTLVALGARGLQALNDLDLPLTQSSRPPAGLILLQGMVLTGPDGKRRLERYTHTKPDQQHNALLQPPAGIAVLDAHSLATGLLALMAGPVPTPERASARNLSRQPSSLPSLSGHRTPLGSQAAAFASAEEAAEGTLPRAPAAGSSVLGHRTPVHSGPTAATSAEEAQEAALPHVVPTIGTETGAKPPVEGADAGSNARNAPVRCHYANELMMVDTVNKQLTFRGPYGEAHVVPYDLLIGADQGGGAHLVASALAELQHRQHAHKHPTEHRHSAAGTATTGSSTAASSAPAPPSDDSVLELEFKVWHDMPHQAELKGLVPKGLDALKHSLDEVGQHNTHRPGQGWLLVWTGSGRQQRASTSLPSVTAATGASSIPAPPGGPTCTLMAWPSRGGGSWSGAVFAAPQVFESLRSQADYEGLLRGLRAPAGDSGKDSGLPGLWIKTIAAQLRANSSKLGRVPAPWLPAPSHITAPPAGLVLLGPAVCPTLSPQLLCPGESLGLEDAAALAAVLSEAGVEGQQVDKALKKFDKQRQPQVSALQCIEAQLSWLRHPFSPAATAALASIPFGSLPWLLGLAGWQRMGLALQWKSFVAVLPLLAATLKVLKSSGLSSNSSQAVATAAGSSSSGGNIAAPQAAATLKDVSEAVRPTGASFMAFLHTAGLPVTALWQLLHAAPVLLAIVWGAGFWIATKLVQWGLLAYRAWGMSQAAAV